jgi:hypothetical protein
MKLLKRRITWVISTVILAGGYITSCTHEFPGITNPTVVSTTELVSVKTAVAPGIDGTIDAAWSTASKLNISPAVPDPGNNLFTGYIGDKYPANLRSMYDDQYIYFLAEYPDDSKSVYVATWYFNPATKRWAQESTSKTFDDNGILKREGFGEDKLAMLWNIDHSTAKFTTQTCYASCHVFTPYIDYSVTPAVNRSNAASGNHYTSGVNEKIDMWWAHLSRDVQFNQMDDNYQDWAGGGSITNLTGGNANGRHVDGIVVSGTAASWPFRPTYTTTPPQGASNNRQTLKLDGTGAAVTVPAWIIPGASNYYNILASDTLPGGKAQKIVAVSSTGVLSYEGGDIDPNTDTEYQRTGDAVTGGDGAKCFPSYIASPLIGSRADITCGAIYTGSGWIVEYKRLLKTADELKQDIDFSSLEDQQFGVALWNRSNNQHGIETNLTLKFKK